MLKLKKLYKNYFRDEESSELYNLFVNKLLGRFLKQGKKEYSIKLFYKIKYLLKKRAKREPSFLLLFSMFKGLFPFYFIKKRLGRTIKDLPLALLKTQQVRYYVKRLYKFSKARKIRKGFSLSNLVNLFIRICRSKSPLIKQNNKNYRKVLVNRVFLFILKKRK
jgi:hypothetical protein